MTSPGMSAQGDNALSATANTARPEDIFRRFEIDGELTADTTNRTRIVESITTVAGRSFLDVGAADGYEARALALRGASRAVAMEGKDSLYVQAARAAELLGLPNHVAVQGDLRVADQYGLGKFDCVLCFGVLYHMANPYNVLKHLAQMTDDLLLLETHIAPEPWAEDLLLPKHAGALMHGTRTLYLDGERFEGRVCIHRGDQGHSKGSLDENWTFWLSQASLAKALTRAGFEVIAWYHEPDAATPMAIARDGKGLGFGHANTKVFVVARVNPDRRAEATPGTISERQDAVVAPRMAEGAIDRLRFLAGRIKRRLFRPQAA